MGINGCVTMILAGGRGERLGALARYYSKPAIHFGSKFRIIDFTLRNCRASGIDIIGVLSQLASGNLNQYIEAMYGDGHLHSDLHMLPPRDGKGYYRGTADAVYKNIDFIEHFQAECILVLAGDHIYNMDYRGMIDFHRSTGADVTVASTLVPLQDASRFGILNADESGRIRGFEEKPRFPKSRLASMGIYVFKWKKLKKYLLADSACGQTEHDFGKNILPEMLRTGESMYTYQFSGYWRDVGTVESLWEANMDQIDHPSALQTLEDWPETPRPHVDETSYIACGAHIHQSIISENCTVCGNVEHSVLGDRVTVGEGAEIVDSVVMPGAYIGNNAKVYKAVIGAHAWIMNDSVIGMVNGSDFFIDSKICTSDISLVAPWIYIGKDMRFQTGSHICEERFLELTPETKKSLSIGMSDTSHLRLGIDDVHLFTPY